PVVAGQNGERRWRMYSHSGRAVAHEKPKPLPPANSRRPLCFRRLPEIGYTQGLLGLAFSAALPQLIVDHHALSTNHNAFGDCDSAICPRSDERRLGRESGPFVLHAECTNVEGELAQSYTFVLLGSLLLLFAFTRFIVRLLRR